MMFIESFWTLFSSMALWLLVGFIAAGLVGVLVPQAFIAKHLTGRGIGPYIKATVLGIPMPLCSCSVIPTAVSFYKKGASKGATVSFLISTPQTGVDSVFLTSVALGWPFTLVKILSSTVMGLIGGFIAGPSQDETVQESKKADSSDSKLMQFFKFTFIELPSPLAVPFIVGIAINAVVSIFVEPGTLGNLVGQGPLVLLLVLVCSVPLYVCTTASIPLAILLLQQGLGPGAALVFLIAGPATNTATIIMVGKTLGMRGLIAYLGPVIIGSLLIGIVMPNILPVPEGLGHAHHHEHHSIVDHIAAVFLMALMVYPIGKTYYSKLRLMLQASKGVKFVLTGLTCQGCVRKAENALAEKKIDVLHISKTELDVDIKRDKIKDIQELFENLGFKAAIS